LGVSCSDATTQPLHPAVHIPEPVLASLVDAISTSFPKKCFGYLVAEAGGTTPIDFVLFHDNHRNDRAWRPRFEAYGEYFVAHPDAGFVASPEESLRVQQLLWQRDLCEVGVFHSHQRHPANFSQIDYDLHIQRFPRLWHLIVSLRNRAVPQARAFDVRSDGVDEIPIVTHRIDA
jgi:proteasome lid subunit RPN8/RPN11